MSRCRRNTAKNVLIVHAHHEPKSFDAALLARGTETLRACEHEVVVSDLHAMNFNPAQRCTGVRRPEGVTQSCSAGNRTIIPSSSGCIGIWQHSRLPWRGSGTASSMKASLSDTGGSRARQASSM